MSVWGCKVARKLTTLLLLVGCAVLALLVMWTGALAQTGDTTTTTTAADNETTSTTEGVETTTTSSTTTTSLKIVEIPSPVEGAAPTFASAGRNRIAWTGLAPGGYSVTYLLDLAAMTNTSISPTKGGHYYNPACDGPWVVYQGSRAGAADQDIFVYDTGNGLTTQITHNSDPGDGSDFNPRMHNGRIVWEKKASGPAFASGIYFYDLQVGGLPTVLLQGKEYHNPDIWGDYVVCTREIAGRSDVILYDLKTKTSTSIGVAGKNNENPRIDSGKVVWSSGDIPDGLWYPWSTYQIQVYDITTGTRKALTDNRAGNFSPTISGPYIAWKQRDPAAIVFYNSASERTQQIAINGVPENPDMAEDLLVFRAGTSLYYFRVPQEDAFPFPDVEPVNPYSTAIGMMAMYRIIEGYEDGRFGPLDLITRQQFAKMIVLTMAQWKPEVFTPTFSDRPPSPFVDQGLIERKDDDLYPYYYVAKAAATGLVVGYPDRTFRPFANITRQQVITIVVRAARQLLATPPAGWQGYLGYSNPAHGENIRVAEFNGLLDGIQGPLGTLGGWDTSGAATRAEVAQMLYNLLNKLLATR